LIPPSEIPKIEDLDIAARYAPNGVINYISLGDLKTLRWAASIGCVEMHSFLHNYPYVSCPTLVAFDLDPGEGTDVLDCCEAPCSSESGSTPRVADLP
jgi:DNA primase